ncbi:MAG: ketoacyl-ACP synthase III [candidate division KSB1 bacterium]|nr:ketoacyl-ACP synthase III [candidate division KSB1 bacterium]MDZ7301841.1 ketoacyl-ACP synthase III [candidate division KSB1 bacterium]MDZ7310224.1 ketoacyl-ACP synthase III [candidate division KSB1 bacterium]
MILGTGRAVPRRVLTNFDLEKMVETTDEWIRERTGIERRYIAEEQDTTSALCAAAGRAALQAAQLPAGKLDAIILGTVTGDVTFPATACYVQEILGAENAAAFDIAAACSGFIYGLALADGLIASGKAQHVLVIGGELLSRITDWTDRATCVLFGDAAGAAVLGPSDGKRGIIDTFMKSDGRLTSLLCMPGGGTKVPPDVALSERMMFLRMEGREVFKYAVTAMGDAAEHILARNNLTGNDIDLLIPHQANMRIITATAKRVGLPMEKVYVNVQDYGNTSAASIPIAMNEALEKGRLKSGERCLIVAFGAGFTWGSAIIQF